LLNFLVRKILYGLLVMLGVTVMVFFLFQGFGDPARLVLGQTGDAETLKNIRKELYLDQPKGKQFLYYLRDISPVSIHTTAEIRDKQLKGLFIGGNRKLAIKVPYLRRSYQSKRQVMDVLSDALPGTLVLAGAAMAFATVTGIFLGILAAVKKGTWWDSAAIFSSVVGISAPSFFMGILIAWLFGFTWSSWTGLHMTGSLFGTDAFTGRRLELQNLILPALTLGIRPLAIIAQLTRSSMLDVLGQDYIRTAYAKGLSTTAVIFRHGLRNAINPVITAITGWFAELLAGAFFIEYIFGWKGIGKITVDALEKLDYPLVMGSVLLTACLFVMVNILADLLYSIVDPRIGLK
jgi:ABC-type dipeptide/oligopeptide/nickel transport system permease component